MSYFMHHNYVFYNYNSTIVFYVIPFILTITSALILSKIFLSVWKSAFICIGASFMGAMLIFVGYLSFIWKISAIDEAPFLDLSYFYMADLSFSSLIACIILASATSILSHVILRKKFK